MHLYFSENQFLKLFIFFQPMAVSLIVDQKLG